MGRLDAIGTIARANSGIGSIASARVHRSTASMRVAIEELTARAQEHVHVDIFRISDPQVVSRLSMLPERGVSLSVLADTEKATGHLADELRRVASAWHELGGRPFKQHGKAMSRDGGAEALVATDIADEYAFRRIELAASFTGAPARALAAVHDASAGGGAALDDAMRAAAATGVLVNDPRSPVRWATEAVAELIANGDSPMRLVTKQFDMPALSRTLAERAADGLELEVITHTMPKAQQQRLRDAGASVQVLDEAIAERAGLALHGTMLEAGERALLGSLFLQERVLHGSKGRQSRELAVMLAGAAAADARAAVHAAVEPLTTLVPTVS